MIGGILRIEISRTFRFRRKLRYEIILILLANTKRYVSSNGTYVVNIFSCKIRTDVEKTTGKSRRRSTISQSTDASSNWNLNAGQFGIRSVTNTFVFGSVSTISYRVSAYIYWNNIRRNASTKEKNVLGSSQTASSRLRCCKIGKIFIYPKPRSISMPITVRTPDVSETLQFREQHATAYTCATMSFSSGFRVQWLVAKVFRLFFPKKTRWKSRLQGVTFELLI